MLGASDETLRKTWPGFVERYNAALGGIIGANSDLIGEYQQSNPRFRGYVPTQPQKSQGAAPAAQPKRLKWNPATGRAE